MITVADKINEEFNHRFIDNALCDFTKEELENFVFDFLKQNKVILPSIFHIEINDNNQVIAQNNDTIDFLNCDWNFVSKQVDWVKANKLSKSVIELSNPKNYNEIRMIDCGKVSDGFHTFDDLYEFRLLYNAAMFNCLPRHIRVIKSKRHSDGEECFGGGWFIVQAQLPTGQISNHYEMKYWDLFKIPEEKMADEWDGHTPEDVIERLRNFCEEY